MAILKRVFSVFLALALILTAVLILGLAIGRTFNSLANIFYLIRDYHFRLKAFHTDYCWVHNLINYNDYYRFHERAAHELIFSSGFAGDITLKSPVLCMIAQTVASITATLSRYAGAFAIFFLAIVAATHGKNKMLKLVRTIFGVGASLSLIKQKRG